VLAETSVTVTNEEKTFEWNDYGLRLYIPQGSLPAGYTHCCIKIRVAISGQFQFPEGSTPVSAVYWLSSDLDEMFPQHLSLQIQHCAKPSAVDELKMVTATTTSHTFAFQFQCLKGGVFSQSSCYGRIQLSRFSLWSTIWNPLKSFFSSPPLIYYSRIYYTERIIWRCEAHVVITQNLEACFKVSYFAYTKEVAEHFCMLGGYVNLATFGKLLKAFVL